MFIHCANIDMRMIGSTLEIEAKYLSKISESKCQVVAFLLYSFKYNITNLKKKKSKGLLFCDFRASKNKESKNPKAAQSDCSSFFPAVFVLKMGAWWCVTVMCKLTIYGIAKSLEVECAAPKP